MNKISELPFFHGSCAQNDNGGHPHQFPIDIYYDEDYRMFRAGDSPALSDLLNKVYLEGSLVDGSISSESGEVYVKGILDYLEADLKTNKEAEILEIGFGKGIILKGLRERGFTSLTGIEPGNHSLLDGLEDITLINDFFPSQQIDKSFDLIYHFAVWEHVVDPEAFIHDQIAHLTEEGSLIFGVPNCEPYVPEGDISFFLHEHYSYFTSQAITRAVEKADGHLNELKVMGGMLVGTINRTAKSDDRKSILNNPEVTGAEFWKQVITLEEKLAAFVANYPDQKDLAVYVPGRALNVLFRLGAKDVRLIDDNSEMKSRFLPCLNSAIESFEDLCQNPPKAILIYSKTFGHKIKTKCLQDSRLNNTEIFSLEDVI